MDRETIEAAFDEQYELRRDARLTYLEELADAADAHEAAARREW